METEQNNRVLDIPSLDFLPSVYSDDESMTAPSPMTTAPPLALPPPPQFVPAESLDAFVERAVSVARRLAVSTYHAAVASRKQPSLFSSEASTSAPASVLKFALREPMPLRVPPPARPTASFSKPVLQPVRPSKPVKRHRESVTSPPLESLRTSPSALASTAPAPHPAPPRRRAELGPWNALGMKFYNKLEAAENGTLALADNTAACVRPPTSCCALIDHIPGRCSAPLGADGLGLCDSHAAELPRSTKAELDSLYELTAFTARLFSVLKIGAVLHNISLYGAQVWGGVAPWAREAHMLGDIKAYKKEHGPVCERLARLSGFGLYATERCLVITGSASMSMTVTWTDADALFSAATKLTLAKSINAYRPNLSKRALEEYDPGYETSLPTIGLVRLRLATALTYFQGIRRTPPCPPHLACGIRRPRSALHPPLDDSVCATLAATASTPTDTYELCTLDVYKHWKTLLTLTTPGTYDIGYACGTNRAERWLFTLKQDVSPVAFAILKWFDVGSWDRPAAEPKQSGAEGAAARAAWMLPDLHSCRILYLDILGSHCLHPGAGKKLLGAVYKTAQALACSELGDVWVMLEAMSEELVTYYARHGFVRSAPAPARFMHRVASSRVPSTIQTGMSNPYNTSYLLGTSVRNEQWTLYTTLKPAIVAEERYRTAIAALPSLCTASKDSPAQRKLVAEKVFTALAQMLADYGSVLKRLLPEHTVNTLLWVQSTRILRWMQAWLAALYEDRTPPDVSISESAMTSRIILASVTSETETRGTPKLHSPLVNSPVGLISPLESSV